MKHNMTYEEILDAGKKFETSGGMTVNERLYVSGLVAEFEKARFHAIVKAAFIPMKPETIASFYYTSK